MIAASPFARIQIELGSAAYDDCTASAIRKRMKTRELTGGSFAIFANSRRFGEFRFRSKKTQYPTWCDLQSEGGVSEELLPPVRAAVSEMGTKNAGVPSARRKFAGALSTTSLSPAQTCVNGDVMKTGGVASCQSTFRAPSLHMAF